MKLPAPLARFAPTLCFALLALAAFAAVLIWGPLFADRYDWHYFESMGEMARRTVLWYHQAPLWNPYSCGGEVGLANPQSLSASPSFLLVLLFGTALGYKLGLVLYYTLALDGGFRLARRLGVSPLGAALAGLGYGFSGYLGLRFASGHVSFWGVALYPYLLLCFDRALDAWEWTIPCGLVIAWIVGQGGTFPTPMAGELLFLWAAVAVVQRRSARPLLLLALAAAVALVVGAARVLPLWEFVHDHPRHLTERAIDWSAPWQVLADLVVPRTQLEMLAGRKYATHEYAARLAFAVLPLALLGLLGVLGWKRVAPERRRSATRLWVLCTATWLLAMGNFDPPLTVGGGKLLVAPWSLLQKLPVLRDLRVPSRHLVLLVLGLAVLAGLAYDQLGEWLTARRGPGFARRWRHVGCALVALAAVDGAVYTALCFRGVFVVERELPAGPVPFFQVHGYWSNMRETLFAGHGSIDTPGSKYGPGCDEEAPLQRADALDAGDVPQARLLDPAAGEVLDAPFTPNVRAITVALRRPTTLVVNSNWNEHWRLDPPLPGARITQVAGRLAIDLSGVVPGRHTVVLRYLPHSFTVGAGVSALALPLALALFFVARRRRARSEAVSPRGASVSIKTMR